jgi:hypothetical protein
MDTDPRKKSGEAEADLRRGGSGETDPLTELVTARPKLRMPLVMDWKKPPPAPDEAGRSWSLDPMAGGRSAVSEGSPRAEGGGDMLGFGMGAGGGQAAASCLPLCVVVRRRRRSGSDGDVAVLELEYCRRTWNGREEKARQAGGAALGC